MSGSRLSFVLALGMMGMLAGCRATTDEGNGEVLRSRDAVSATRIDIRRDGGIAGLRTDLWADLVTGGFGTVTRRMCEAPSCPPPIDSVAGTLTRAQADALIARIAEADFFNLRDDCGVTANAADLFFYAVTIRRGGDSKTVRADDLSMPQPLARIVADLSRVFDGAGRRAP